jgi:hypothetical protein
MSTAALSLAAIPDYFANAAQPPEPCGAYVWWRFGDVRPTVEQVESALNAYAEAAGIPWKVGDRVEISPSSAMRAAAASYKYNLPSATVEGKVVYDDGVEGKVCLLRKRLVGVNKGATVEGETVCEVYFGLHSLNVKPVIVAKDAAFGEGSAAVQAFLADLQRERTTIGYLTLRPAYLVPALRAAQAIGQKSRAGFYWVPERSASKVNALAAFMRAIGSNLRIVLLYAHQGTIEGLEEGTKLHLSDLVDELVSNVGKLKDQADRGRQPRADSVATAQALILEIRETGELVREVLGLRMDDVLSALSEAEREFKAITEGGKSKAKATPEPTPAVQPESTEPAPKRRGRAPKSAPVAEPTPIAQDATPVIEPEPNPLDDLATNDSPAQDCEPTPAEEPIFEEQSAPLPEPEPVAEPAPVVEPEPTPEPEPAEDEGIKWPTDEKLKALNRDALRAFVREPAVKGLYEAKGVKGVTSFNPDQLRSLIVLLRDGDGE